MVDRINARVLDMKWKLPNQHVDWKSCEVLKMTSDTLSASKPSPLALGRV